MLVAIHELSRIAVRAQLLDAAHPATRHDVVRQLTLPQIDPVAAIAPNADLAAWSLAARVYPDDPVVPAADALRTRYERRLRALGIARARGPACPVEPADVADRKAGVPRVHALHQDIPFTKEMSVVVSREMEDLARWLELDLIWPD